MKGRAKKSLISVFSLAVFAVGASWYFQRGYSQPPPFQTAKVTRGDLVSGISATGTVEPVEVVDVGAQVAGQILSFGQDAGGGPVDYGSVVESGTVLAKIDDSLYSADEAQAESQVKSAKANVQRAEADLLQAKAKLHQAERDWRRAQKLGPSEALSQASYDSYLSAYETAKANLSVSEAAILQSKAGLAQSEAVLRKAQRNLGYCTIKSPVKGVVIDRRVNIGQTVVSSLNAPSLFLIAKDLTRMQVWAAVNEADIGRLHPGQRATFTVDAFPGETFEGEVGKVRLNASMTQNVVTYTVEVVTDNAGGRLLPYLTASVQFELDRRAGVLLAPSAALKWKPSMEQVEPTFREAYQKRAANRSRPGEGRRGGPGSAGRGGGRAARGTLWTVEGAYVRPLEVRVGASSGGLAEVEAQDLSEGLTVVTGLESADGGSSRNIANPFAPRFPGRGRGMR